LTNVGEMAPPGRNRRRGECGLLFWRDGRVVECGGLENRCPPIGGSGVRIPLSPQSQNKSRASGIVCFNKVPKKACFLKEMKVKQTKTRKGLFWLCKDPPKGIADFV
jgi:hypothetical protein